MGNDPICYMRLLHGLFAEINIVIDKINVLHRHKVPWDIIRRIDGLLCYRAESCAIVEDREMQCPRPSKMTIRLERPVICRTAIAKYSDT